MAASGRPRLRVLWEAVRTSYWFVPGLLLLAGGGAALALTGLDQRLGADAVAGLAGVYAGGAEGARAMLAAIATSVLAVAGTTFSITIAVLSLTSSQFGPRLLRNFLRDSANQVVLGTFIGTFLYTLLVMRTVRSVEETAFVPHLSVTAGVGLAVLCVAMLVFFIHHVIGTIQASNVIARAGAELARTIERLHPESPPEHPAASPPLLEGEGALIEARQPGYVQAIDAEALMRLAADHGLVVRMERRLGDFVAAGMALATAFPAATLADEVREGIRAACSLGPEGTQVDDVGHPLSQLTEIAVRALSPSINDPRTAILCIDQLTAALCVLARRPMATGTVADASGRARVLLRTPGFVDILHLSFDPIRRHGRSEAAVLARLLEVIAEIAACTGRADHRRCLREQFDLVCEEARSGPASREARAWLARFAPPASGGRGSP